jgi:hypothetical protein
LRFERAASCAASECAREAAARGKAMGMDGSTSRAFNACAFLKSDNNDGVLSPEATPKMADILHREIKLVFVMRGIAAISGAAIGQRAHAKCADFSKLSYLSFCAASESVFSVEAKMLGTNRSEKPARKRAITESW